MKYSFIFFVVISFSLTLFSCKQKNDDLFKHENTRLLENQRLLEDSIVILQKKIKELYYTAERFNSYSQELAKEEAIAYWSSPKTIQELKNKGIDDPEIQKIILELNKRMKQLKDESEYLQSTQLLTYWFDENNVEYLKEKGIKNPQKDIMRNLRNRKNLLADEAILGGTMRYGNITLLGDCWAIAYAEDGHIGINMLLKYEVQNNKSIKWKVLDTDNAFK